MLRRIIRLAAVTFLLAACDSDKVVRSVQFVSDDKTNKIELTGSADAPARFTWSSPTPGIQIFNANLPTAYFLIPPGDEKQVEVKLIARGDKGKPRETIQVIDVPAFSTVRAYGIGKNLSSSFSNDTEHQWYMDQGNTGQHSSVNCGPTSVTMAIKWYDKSFAKTPEDARNTYRAGGGWWFTSDILAYLSNHNVPHRTIALNGIDALDSELLNGNIVILCLDMYLVSYQPDPSLRVNKFYATTTTGWGHFIVVKGMMNVDGKTFYETYDPYSLGARYDDGQLKGLSRYYRQSDLDKATGSWWDYAIVVGKEDKGGRTMSIDPSTIVHAPGR